MSLIPNIAVSIGDPYGIGPEVITRSLLSLDLRRSTPIIISPHSLIKDKIADCPIEEISQLPFKYIYHSNEVEQHHVNVFESVEEWSNFSFVHQRKYSPSTDGGKVSMESVHASIQLCLDGICDAMVTAPISKESIALAGYKVPGHTEYLMQITKSKDVVMMLSGKGLNLCLLSTHVPLSEVAKNISKNLIQSKIEIITRHFNTFEHIKHPKIALLGLNPHAGDGGILGSEEELIYKPLIESLKKKYMRVEGPYPADAFFGRRLFENFDVVLASYHDQGLAPFKLWTMGEGVNITLGLPIIRTSPDHGTAFDIAHTWEANSSSMLAAYEKALDMSQFKL
ncbi:MAG: 4-hydroxythreonine-4-phosphate dehydrogenase PdxA [Bacteroidetes bacterium]|nr:4-hydroxythreonine-4-phosphate dehydrogenase PdxA [Bacteroidota bacterium]